MPVEAGLFLSDGSFRSREEIMSQIKPPDMEVTRPIIDDPLSFEEHLARVEQLQEIKKETGLWKEEMTVEVKTNGFPFFVMRPLSDMHMGAIGTDMTAIREHLGDIKKYPIYTPLVGDIGDFFGPFKHQSGMLGDVIDPDDQLSMLRRFYEEYKEKILCTVQDPSHTDWIRQATGIEPQRLLVEKLGITALVSGGLMTLKVNEQTYKILLFHAIGKYSSSLNLTNAGKRMLDMADDCDIVLSGHTHIGSMEKLVKRMKKATILQMGTFKTKDDFGRRLGLKPNPQVFFPTLFFDGRKHNIEMIEDRESATKWMDIHASLLTLTKS